MAEDQKSYKPPHVLLFPFPSQGHMNPLIQFGKRLISKGVESTFVTTVFIANTILHNSSTTTTIEIQPISDGFDNGGYDSADSSETYLKTFQEIGSKSLRDLIKKLQSEGKKIDAIIYDSLIPWALDVAMEFGINGGSFFTQACAVNNIYYQVYKGLISVPPVSSVYVPGLQQLERWETPSFVNYGPYPAAWSKVVLFNQFANIHQARWVFSNTFYKLEEEVIKWMKDMWNLKVIGPTIPSMYLDKRLDDDTDYGINLLKINHIECVNWLNDKPKDSVVYVSFGSMAQLKPEQMEEVAWGLNDSNVNFLWIVRAEEKEKLPKGFDEDIKACKGLVVAWCRQLDVLAHESIGCFVTHCGFNSTLESISLGVPVVGMPLYSDQTTNAKCLEDVWGVGVRVKADEKRIVRRGNLTSCINKIMVGEKGVIARKNALKWRDLAKVAVDHGGSSDKEIDEFVSELKHTC